MTPPARSTVTAVRPPVAVDARRIMARLGVAAILCAFLLVGLAAVFVGTRPGQLYVQQPWTEKDVTIGCDVWIGSGSILLPGVTVGDHCVIAAGSPGASTLPPSAIRAGQ